MTRRFALLAWCLASALLAYSCFKWWEGRHLTRAQVFQAEWEADVDDLLASRKLPAAWDDCREIKIVGGNPETRALLAKVTPPLSPKKGGKHRLEVLIVLWFEEGKHGALVQYDIENLKSRNTVLEISRTLILDAPGR